MFKSSLLRGILIALIVSLAATLPRLVRPDFEGLYLANHFGYLFFLSLCYWAAADFFVKKRRQRILMVAAFFLVSGIISVLYHKLLLFVFDQGTFPYAEFPFMERLTLRRQRVLLFLRGIVGSAVIYFIVYYLDLLAERQKSQIELEQLRKERIAAQLDALRQQISPHFLFNSLSTLRTIVPDEASKVYVQNLSNVYRYLLSMSGKELVTLEEETAFLMSYLYILQQRFEDGLQVEIAIDPQLNQHLLPPLVLQLLVENAIKHNVVSFEEPLSIAIFSEAKQLVVSNRLQARFSVEESSGKGLDNIRSRYRLICGKSISVASDNGYFTVKLPLLAPHFEKP